MTTFGYQGSQDKFSTVIHHYAMMILDELHLPKGKPVQNRRRKGWQARQNNKSVQFKYFRRREKGVNGSNIMRIGN